MASCRLWKGDVSCCLLAPAREHWQPGTLRDRGGQPGFLQAAWGHGGAHGALSSLAHRNRVLGKTPGVPASS